MDSSGTVRVEVIEAHSRGTRQIGPRSRASAPLSDRSEEIQSAIQQATDIAQASLAQSRDRNGWSIAGMEVVFGVTLTAEAGVILSKASAEAAFQVTVTFERTASDQESAESRGAPRE